MNAAEKERSAKFNIELCAGTDLVMDEQRRFNGGYLFLQDIYYELGLHKICRAISGRHPFEYDFNAILSRFIYTRILYPSSKKSSFEESKRLIEQPSFELHDIYRALSVMAQESDYIQSRLFQNSSAVQKRKTQVIYYDCTNFYFEIDAPRTTSSSVRARRTALFQSQGWGCSWIGMASPYPSLSIRVTEMSRRP